VTVEPGTVTGSPRPRRADARRNVEALLTAARAVFADAGVDAPSKDVADRAGLGVGTLYRHFPRRSDLIVAVFQQEIDACAESFERLTHDPDLASALVGWVAPFTALVLSKHGLAAALHSGDPAYADLPQRVLDRLEPALQSLLDRADEAAFARSDFSAREVLTAVALLCQQVPGQTPELSIRLAHAFVRGSLSERAGASTDPADDAVRGRP
jgi:AcrR family transcriptional regulator